MGNTSLRESEIFELSHAILSEYGLTSHTYTSIEHILERSGVSPSDAAKHLKNRWQVYKDADTKTQSELGLLSDFHRIQLAEVFKDVTRKMTGHNYIYHPTEMTVWANNISRRPQTPAEKRSHGLFSILIDTHDTVEELADNQYNRWFLKKIDSLELSITKQQQTKKLVKKVLEDRVDKKGTIRSEIRKRYMNQFAQMGRNFINEVTRLDNNLDKNYMHAAMDRIIAQTGKVTRGRYHAAQKANFLSTINSFEETTTDAKITSNLHDTHMAYLLKVVDKAHNVRHQLTSGEYKLARDPESVNNQQELRDASQKLSIENLDYQMRRLQQAKEEAELQPTKENISNLQTLQTSLLQEGIMIETIFRKENLGIRNKVSRLDDLQWSYLIADRLFNRLKKTATLDESRRRKIDDWVMDASYQIGMQSLQVTAQVEEHEIKNLIVYNPISLGSAQTEIQKVKEYMTVALPDGRLASEVFTSPQEQKYLPKHLQDIDLFLDDVRKLAKDPSREKTLDKEMKLILAKNALTKELADRSFDRNADAYNSYRDLYSIDGELPKKA